MYDNSDMAPRLGAIKQKKLFFCALTLRWFVVFLKALKTQSYWRKHNCTQYVHFKNLFENWLAGFVWRFCHLYWLVQRIFETCSQMKNLPGGLLLSPASQPARIVHLNIWPSWNSTLQLWKCLLIFSFFLFFFFCFPLIHLLSYNKVTVSSLKLTGKNHAKNHVTL